MKGLLARAAVAVALLLFVATSASWSLESAAAQVPPPEPTPVPGSPTVMIQIEDDNVVVGDPARITLIAFDDQAVDWIRWDARFADDDENENDNAASVAVVPTPASENDNAYDDDEDNADNDNGNDNEDVDPNTDPALAADHDFECDEQTACANVWTVTTSKPGRYVIRAEVEDTTGLRGVSRAEIQVRQTR